MNIDATVATNISAKIDLLKGAKGMSAEKIDATAKDFESLFVSQMVENMFGESSGDSAFGSSETDDIYKGMMTQEYGKIITKSGGIGIADYVKRELLQMQEKKN